MCRVCSFVFLWSESCHATRGVIRPNDGCFVGNGGSRILRFFPVNLYWWQRNILFCVFQVLGFLPLDWLSNENHVRCLIGLFTCDVLLGSNVFQVRTVISRCDWSGKFNSSSQLIRSKTSKQKNATQSSAFSRAWGCLRIISSSSHWFLIALTFILIGSISFQGGGKNRDPNRSR